MDTVPTKGDPNNKISNRIKNILAKIKDCWRFPLQGESDGWRFYLLEVPNSLKALYQGSLSIVFHKSIIPWSTTRTKHKHIFD